MSENKVDNRGKVTVTAIPPNTTLERGGISLTLGPVAFERGGKNDDGSFKAGYLGILPANGFTWDKLKEIEPFFRAKDSKPETSQTEFLSGVFSYLNNEFFRPCWMEAVEGIGEAGKPLNEEQRKTVVTRFRELFEAKINSERGEREKSSVQINKAIANNTAEMKKFLPDFNALRELHGAKNLAELAALGDKLDEKQKSLVSKLSALMETGKQLKVELEVAKAREEAARNKLSKDEKELADLGLL